VLKKRLVSYAIKMEDWDEQQEITFLHAAFCQVGLPRRAVAGDRFERRTGTTSVLVKAGELEEGGKWVEYPIPYGTVPRVMNMYITRQFILTNGERRIELGDSVNQFLKRLGIGNSGGARGALTRFRNQAKSFAACDMKIGYQSRQGLSVTKRAPVIDEFAAWLDLEGEQKTLWPGYLILSEQYATSIAEHAVPLDWKAVNVLQNGSLGLDVYAWLAHKLHALPHGNGVMVPWIRLAQEFGHEYTGQDRMRNWKKEFKRVLKQVLRVYEGARVETITGGLLLKNSPPPVRKIQITLPK